MLGVLALVRAWGLGLRADEGLVDAGRGALLPLASEGAGPPGLAVLVAGRQRAFRIAAVRLCILVDGCPVLAAALLSSVTALGRGTGAGGCGGAPNLGPRLAVRAIGRAGTAWPPIGLGIFGAVALAVADVTVMFDRPNPACHTYDTTLWLLAGHVELHTFLSGVMLC